MLTHPQIRLGDVARFPLGRLDSDEPVYRRRWAVVAFARDAVIVRRLHDGREKVISARWVEQYRLNEPKPQTPIDAKTACQAGRAALHARRLANAHAHQQTDLSQPSYYVSARKGPRHVLLLGPFVDHYSALSLVRDAWPIVRRYEDPWAEVAVGTCKVSDGRIVGKFNAEVLGVGHAD